MAKRSRSRATKAKANGAAKSKATVKLISAGDVKRLVSQCLAFQDKADNATGNMGELIREYADKKGLHRGAFADVKKLYRMGKKNPGKLWLHLAHFDDMREKLGLDGMAKEQGQLLDPGTEDNPDNVVHIPRDVPEGAGDAA